MPVKELYVTFEAFRFRMNYSTISVFDLSDVVEEERAGLGSPFFLENDVNTFQKTKILQ